MQIALRDQPHLAVTYASLLELDANRLQRLTDGCDAVASCLGHNLSFKGIFGPPYRLVTEATQSPQRNVREIHPLGQILAEKAIVVLVRRPLPGTVRIGKVHPNLGALREFLMTCHLLALIMGQGYAHAGLTPARAAREPLQ